MVLSSLFRLFFNCIFSYILIYIDIVIPNWTTGPNENRRIILICIGYYSTTYFLIKALLAIYYQVKWILNCRRCCKSPFAKNRLDKVRVYWDKINQDYETIAKRSN
jgi:hypothetical protein